MNIIMLPEEESWKELCLRPGLPGKDLETVVKSIISRVKSEGDKAVYYFSGKFDGVVPENLKVSYEEILKSEAHIPQSLKNAINIAKKNIESFHSAQLHAEPSVETTKGVRCWRKSVAIEKVGLYIPGGSAPLFSTLLMLGIPAKLAGCGEIIVCTPQCKD